MIHAVPSNSQRLSLGPFKANDEKLRLIWNGAPSARNNPCDGKPWSHLSAAFPGHTWSHATVEPQQLGVSLKTLKFLLNTSASDRPVPRPRTNNVVNKPCRTLAALEELPLRFTYSTPQLPCNLKCDGCLCPKSVARQIAQDRTHEMTNRTWIAEIFEASVALKNANQSTREAVVNMPPT